MTRGVAGPNINLCNAARRRDDDGERVAPGEGALCTRPAGWGTTTPGVGPCKLHGGCTPAVVSNAVRRRVALECSRLLEGMDIEPVTNPVSALEAHLGEMLGWRDVLRARLGELDPQDWRRAGQYGEELNALVTLYTQSLRDVQKGLTDATKIGISARRQQLEEAKFTFMQAIVEQVLRRHGLDPTATDVRASLYEVATELEEGEGTP